MLMNCDRHWFNKEGDYNNVTACSFHKKTNILVTGFASGAFYLHELPQFLLIHSLRSPKSFLRHQICVCDVSVFVT